MRIFFMTLPLSVALMFISASSIMLAAPDGGREDYLAGLALEYKADGEPDFKGAFVLYRAAARAGSREALLSLARLSEPGGPLGQSSEAWRERLLEAAGAGWVEAAYTLAQALERGQIKGEGLHPKDFYYQAALAGHSQSAKRLGELYLFDESSARDEAQGLMWLAVAAENHEAEAALALGRFFYQNKPEAARRWLEKAEGAEASYLLGELYLKERRFVEAVNVFIVAADQNYAPAHLALGLINIENDFGRRPNSREALKHFKLAAQAGLPEGAYRLSHMYLSGQATPKDPITGAFWLHRAGKGGHEKALAEYEKISYNFSVGQKKRLERMISDGLTPTGREPALVGAQ